MFTLVAWVVVGIASWAGLLVVVALPDKSSESSITCSFASYFKRNSLLTIFFKNERDILRR